MWRMTWQELSARQIMLATSCDSILLKKRGSRMWRMTWQAGIICQALQARHVMCLYLTQETRV